MVNTSTPGFVSCFFDIPFPTSVPNGTYAVRDLIKGIAVVSMTLSEGSRSFFRNVPLEGPTSFHQLRRAQQDPPRPRHDHSYLAVNQLHDGTSKSTLVVNSGMNGGFSECKYYSEVCVTFLADEVEISSQNNEIFTRVCDILNPFLDKYRILTEDYRVSQVSLERNFYFATCHTSPLEPEERGLSVAELFKTLETGRRFRAILGHGAFNILRTNSYELLGPRAPIDSSIMPFVAQFVQEDYALPLSYELVLEAISSLQRTRDYKLAIVHAETAVEVHNRQILSSLMIHYGMSDTQADALIDTDRNYWGVKNKLRRLDEWNERYCKDVGHSYVPFVDSALYSRWSSDLYRLRNDAVHAGAAAFTYDQVSKGISVAKECIAFLESRVPGKQNRVQLNPQMSQFRRNAGEVVF